MRLVASCSGCGYEPFRVVLVCVRLFCVLYVFDLVRVWLFACLIVCLCLCVLLFVCGVDDCLIV